MFLHMFWLAGNVRLVMNVFEMTDLDESSILIQIWSHLDKNYGILRSLKILKP